MRLFTACLANEKVIHDKECDFTFEDQIRPIVQRWWVKMITLLYMATCAVNPKQYVCKPRRVLPNEVDQVREGFLIAF